MAGIVGQHRKRATLKARAQAWQSMRIMRTFTIPDILATADIGEHNLRRFILRLERAGYLARVKSNNNGQAGSRTIYRLARNSGPKVPVLWNDGGVYDPNLDRIFGQPEEAANVRVD